MSYTTILGLLIGLGLFFFAIGIAIRDSGMDPFNGMMMFWSLPSILLVLGGTVANAFISYQPRYVTRALENLYRMFSQAKYEQSLILTESKRIIEWAYTVKRAGLLELEKRATGKDAHDFMLKYGIRLLVDGQKPEAVRKFLNSVVNSTFNRSIPVVNVLKNMASTAPAFGMVGTLVGLIIMLASMAENPDGLGQGMALALLTTLYGMLFAKLLFQPAADKTMQRAYIERFRNTLIVECFVMLAEGKMPREIELQIKSMIDPTHALELRKSAKKTD